MAPAGKGRSTAGASESEMASTSGREGPRPARHSISERNATLQGLGMEPIVAAAWLYYQDGLTQSEIAGLLGVSRATVVNLLAESRRRGLVNVAVDTDHLERIALARDVCARYGLDDCIVIPDDGGAVHPSDRIGAAGAQFLAQQLKSGD